MRLKKQYLTFMPALVMVGCTSQQAMQNKPVRQGSVEITQTQTIQVKPTPAPVVTPKPAPKPSYSNFSDWKSDFYMRAISSGYDAQVIGRLLDSAYLNQQVISLDSGQPEFSKMPWEYVDSAVSSGRVSTGKRKFAEQRAYLSQLESQYGVNAEIVAAIWGMESSYGAVTGSSDLPSSLASLAYDGRRQAFAEAQLLSLATLLQRGDVSWSQLDGSWAGGMGQTQFIPETWLKQGVDGDGNGHRNPWATGDALASTANYLSNSGWVRGLAPFYEATVPASFDYSVVGTKQPAAKWASMGVDTIADVYLDANTQMELWLPAGKDGPVLLLSPNFDVIKVYNNSSSYALGVSLLGKTINGQSGLQKSWPRYERPLSTTQVTNLQRRLTGMGYDTKGADGIVGTNTRLAFQRWQADNGQTPDGFITQSSASSLAGW
ncbi:MULTISPECIES: lytic murein transglycosylase [unclassified Psychrobacter]|uniref:lytic murein transglycosylase n=1 Tax=unclassified Psychrobacter TaxID=196806 RepID=UPI0025B3CA91|nr:MULTISPECIES: lytic murein transglycosylase [unclassified Psychrobacter]MDN3453989.1 lytic murein transglycosylase [Psychrobacter sp. APC 3350]MDN3501304.1 lytic murein transglycosylase [Psychrobacter sp. 5A.1]